MAIVTCRNISMEYAGRWVLRDVSFELNAGRKVGLIGPNGSGKTTILRILCELVQPTAGSLQIAGDTRIGYVPQHVEFDIDQTVFEYVMRDHEELHQALRRTEHAVAQAHGHEMDQLLREYQHARDAYDHIGGDHYEQRARAMLDALGLTGRAEQKVSGLSGGEKNVLAMTQALLSEPNLLILDEPGNHLDYLGLAWLEEFLNKFRGAVLIVSHNRYLLDRVVSEIIELDDGQARFYPGNYSAYCTIRRERLQTQQAQYEAGQKRLAHLEALVRKFADIAQGHASDQTWGRRLRARRSQLEREKAKAVDKPVLEPKKITADFRTEATRADIALRISGYSKAFGDLRLFDHVDWDIGGGQRWALIGANGSGKTTLLRDIVNQGRWQHPEIRIGPSLSIGYCAQQQEVLDGDNTVYEELMSLPHATRETVLGILARFLFCDEEVNKKIDHLSGGERNRLQLARLMLLKPNFLILDEPTNHLDIPTREAVEQALADFKGTLLVVSHDRYFLDKVVDHVAEVRDRTLCLYDGNFTSFWQARMTDQQKTTGRISNRRRDRQTTDQEKPKLGGQAWQQRKAQIAVLRKAQKALEQTETDIAQAEEQKQRLEQRIAHAFSHSDHEQGHQLSQQLRQLTLSLESLYQRWLEQSENLPDDDTDHL